MYIMKLTRTSSSGNSSGNNHVTPVVIARRGRSRPRREDSGSKVAVRRRVSLARACKKEGQPDQGR